MEKEKVIEKMLKEMGDRNNTIDLDAYARGLIDMWDNLHKTDPQTFKEAAEKEAKEEYPFEDIFIKGAQWAYRQLMGGNK